MKLPWRSATPVCRRLRTQPSISCSATPRMYSSLRGLAQTRPSCGTYTRFSNPDPNPSWNPTLPYSPNQVRHLDGSVESAELGAAERYLAAGHARNEVVVHVDDDAVPDEQNLSLLSRTFCSVHAEPGFPACAPHLPRTHPATPHMWSACSPRRTTPATSSRTRPAVLDRYTVQPNAPCSPSCNNLAGIPTARLRGYTGQRRATAARQATAHRCE